MRLVNALPEAGDQEKSAREHRVSGARSIKLSEGSRPRLRRPRYSSTYSGPPKGGFNYTNPVLSEPWP